MIKRAHSQMIDQAEAGTWLSAGVALAMHYGGSITMAPEILGATLAAVLLPVAMVAIRFLNRLLADVPVDNPPTVELSEDLNQDGFAAIALLPVLAAIGILLMMTAGGCGSSYHLKDGGWRLEQADCGTRLTVFGDGDPEVSVICIADAAPLKVGPKARSVLCGAD